MKQLYIASDNYTTYLYRRDFDREEKDCQLCDLDLNEEEIKEIYEKQEEQENKPSLFPYENYNEIRERMNMMITLEAYIKNME